MPSAAGVTLSSLTHSHQAYLKELPLPVQSVAAHRHSTTGEETSNSLLLNSQQQPDQERLVFSLSVAPEETLPDPRE